MRSSRLGARPNLLRRCRRPPRIAALGQRTPGGGRILAWDRVRKRPLPAEERGCALRRPAADERGDAGGIFARIGQAFDGLCSKKPLPNPGARTSVLRGSALWPKRGFARMPQRPRIAALGQRTPGGGRILAWDRARKRPLPAEERGCALRRPAADERGDAGGIFARIGQAFDGLSSKKPLPNPRGPDKRSSRPGTPAEKRLCEDAAAHSDSGARIAHAMNGASTFIRAPGLARPPRIAHR